MAKTRASRVYYANRFVIPSCRRFCVNVCNRLFLVGRQQCIADCLNCGGLLFGGAAKAKVKSRKSGCGCGCGKCKK
ncbi:hypothetical protein SD70_30700 [Gordoniibacillus kamchatkensis]|uniref:Uncharacterized protein n=1 Tax=Gordoniibacillus kamchatkensis TaxID=1590651 RepID=A0ABR5A9U8_9BACL|nr:hypothetical protein [Paenibacillus sp. VKM B-2647]KIL37774.1 hypothetical protein SD70_30700 [Paenibacillus sp. VKM B-2647]